MIKKKIFIFLVGILFPIIIHAAPIIRVEILQASSLDIAGSDGLNVMFADGQVAFSGKAVQIRFDPNGMILNGKVLNVDVLAITSPGILQINKHRYRGAVNVQRNEKLVEAINQVDLEKYLYSVVGSEMSYRWPAEALKAQAVVARTYALKKMDEHKALAFDVVSTFQDQAYDGVEDETPSTREAVDVTRGEALFYQGKIITAYYNSDCGGRTEKGENVFPGPLPYLQSVSCPFAGDSPYLHWSRTFSLFELSERLGKTIRDLSIDEDPETGRVSRVVLQTSAGAEAVPGFIFRRLLGTRDLRSTQFEIKKVERIVYIPKEEFIGVTSAPASISIFKNKPKGNFATVVLTGKDKLFLIHGRGDLLEENVSDVNPLVAISEGGFLFTLYHNLAARTYETTIVGNLISIPSKKNMALKSRIVWIPIKTPVAVTFTGRGWGHGVGLCQWGSRGMALQGKSYEDILHYYYKDVEIKDAY